jgi:hypothetical protein
MIFALGSWSVALERTTYVGHNETFLIPVASPGDLTTGCHDVAVHPLLTYSSKEGTNLVLSEGFRSSPLERFRDDSNSYLAL